MQVAVAPVDDAPPGDAVTGSAVTGDTAAAAGDELAAAGVLVVELEAQEVTTANESNRAETATIRRKGDPYRERELAARHSYGGSDAEFIPTSVNGGCVGPD